MWFACVIFIAIFGIAECKGVLRASIDAGAKEEPRAARIYQAAGEQVAPPRERLHTCQTGIAPVRGSHLYLIALCIFFSFFQLYDHSVAHLFVFFFSIKGKLYYCDARSSSGPRKSSWPVLRLCAKPFTLLFPSFYQPRGWVSAKRPGQQFPTGSAGKLQARSAWFKRAAGGTEMSGGLLSSAQLPEMCLFLMRGEQNWCRLTVARERFA